MRVEDQELAAVKGMRTFSTNVPALLKELTGVVNEIKACEESGGVWKRENLSKTAKVLRKMEDDHEEQKKGAKEGKETKGGKEGKEDGKEEGKEDARGTKSIQGWFPIHCAKCCACSGKTDVKLCETGQVLCWRSEKDGKKKVEMICCRIRMHTCCPVVGEFNQPFEVVEKKTEEKDERERGGRPGFPHEEIVGNTFDGPKETLDQWKPELRLAPPGFHVDLGLGVDNMRSNEETR